MEKQKLLRKRKAAFIMNLAIVVIDIIAVVWMMCGPRTGVLTSSRLSALKFFTVDSNILMGIVAGIVAADLWRVLKGKKEDLAESSYVLALTGTVGVTLTMLVTIFFLAPTMGPKVGVLSLFAGSNFFLHLVNPILSIIVFLGFERSVRLKFRYTFVGIIPLVIYAIYYTVEALTHMQDGVIAPGYDWYGFFFLGPKSAVIVLPMVIAVTYGISVLLWRLNRARAKGKSSAG